MLGGPVEGAVPQDITYDVSPLRAIGLAVILAAPLRMEARSI